MTLALGWNQRARMYPVLVYGSATRALWLQPSAYGVARAWMSEHRFVLRNTLACWVQLALELQSCMRVRPCTCQEAGGACVRG